MVEQGITTFFFFFTVGWFSTVVPNQGSGHLWFTRGHEMTNVRGKKKKSSSTALICNHFWCPVFNSFLNVNSKSELITLAVR